MNQDPEQDIYQETGHGTCGSNMGIFDFALISMGGSLDGSFCFHNSNTVHECRFELVGTTVRYEIILTEQMVQVNDLFR